MAAAVTMAFGVALTAQPTDAASKRAQCLKAASNAVGSKVKPGNYRIVLGTKKSNTFKPSAKNDLFCGFGGNDKVRKGVLKKNDIFIGGGGKDSVVEVRGGLFVGGKKADVLGHLRGGAFHGGQGGDVIGVIWRGYFKGGKGADRTLGGDEFGFEKGRFDGGPGDDVVEEQSGGTFDGGSGTDSVLRLVNGTLISVEICVLDGGGPCP